MPAGGLLQLLAYGAQDIFDSEPQPFQHYTVEEGITRQSGPPFTVIEKNRRRPTKLAECPICLESIAHMEMALTSCKHQFCNTCINKLAKANQRVCTCPLCRANITSIRVDVRRAK